MDATVLATASSVLAVLLIAAVFALWRLYQQGERRTDAALAAVRDERARADQRQDALRRYEVTFASVSGRGELGEQVLVETARTLGLRENLHFTVQSDLAGGGTVRPDMVLLVGGGRSVPVDAKTSLACWAEAVETDDLAERFEALRVHARNIRARAKELAGKNYQRWADAIYGTIMFVPSDAAVVAAMDTDPDLLRWLLDRRVFLCGPTGFAVIASATMFAASETVLTEDVNNLRDQALGAHRSAGNAIEALNLSSTHLQRFLSARRREMEALEGFRASVTPLTEAAGAASATPSVRKGDEWAAGAVPDRTATTGSGRSLD